MTKPAKIAVGIGVAAVACALLAVSATGLVRLAWAWTAASCVVAGLAYVLNRPSWLGKRAGRHGPALLVVLPYLLAFRVACWLMRWWRGGDAPTLVAPGVWVAGRIGPDVLPDGVTHVVDLVAEYPARRAVRRLPGYRNLPVLDGGAPPHAGAVLRLLEELARADGDVLVHCDSGRGRAPTFAAALLVVRGLAPDTNVALRTIRSRRPVSAPTRSDLAFLASLSPGLETLRREVGAVRVPGESRAS